MKISEINSNPSFKALDAYKAAQMSCSYFDKFLQKSDGSCLSVIKKSDMSPDNVFKFLCHSTSSKYTAKKIAQELSSNPRKAENIQNLLIQKLGGESDYMKGYDRFMLWFHDERAGYRNAYSWYYSDDVWNKAAGLDELLKQSPNLAPWAVKGKAEELNCEFVFGRVPDEFKSIKKFRKLIDNLKHSEFHKAYVRARNFEAQNLGTDSMLASTLTNEYLSKLSKPFLTDADGIYYEAEPIIKSFSSKLIYKLSPQGDKTKKFILKIDPYETKGLTDKAAKFTENQDLRPDMPYLDAMVDFYLKENKSPNAPEILFYDHFSKTALYKATEGEIPKIPERFVNNIYSFVNYDKIADIKRLGVELSDIHADNFRVAPDGTYKLIDSGHVKYSSVFRPPVVSKHIVTGNLCGRELCK